MTSDTIHNLYNQLSPANQDVVAMLIRNLAQRDGIEAVDAASLLKPRDGIELWASDAELRGLARQVVKQYRRSVETLLDKYEAPTEVDIRSFLAELHKSTDNTSGTMANYVKAFRVFFRYLYDNQLWNTNPALKIKFPKIKYNVRRIPTEEDVRKLLAVIDDADDLLAIMFLLNTGLRISEMCGIRTADVDLDQRRISVIGKGDKQRYIYINSAFFVVFAPYVVVAREHKQKWLFPAKRSDTQQGHTNRSSVAYMLKRYCDKAEIDVISPHQLRHFFATYVLSRGGDVKAVSEFLGHADVTITLKIYHHIGERSMRDVIERLAPAAQDKLALTGATVNGEFVEVDK